MTTKTAKLKNGIITLPRELRKDWKGPEVFVWSERDTLVIKRPYRSLSRLSGLANRISAPKMNQKEIEKEIQSYRNRKTK